MSLRYTLCFLFVMQSQVQWIRFCNTLFNICFTKLMSCFVHKSPISLACVYLPQMLNFHLLNEWTNSNLFRHNYLCSLISYCCFLHFTKSILFVLEPSFFCIWCSCPAFPWLMYYYLQISLAVPVFSLLRFHGYDEFFSIPCCMKFTFHLFTP